MTASHRNLAAFLRRAGLLAGLLAIIAGIFGMHVMTGTHSMHSPAAVTAITDGVHAGAAAADGHAVQQASGTSRAHPAADIRDAAGTPAQMCSCSDCGTGRHAMTTSCIPSVKRAPWPPCPRPALSSASFPRQGPPAPSAGTGPIFPGLLHRVSCPSAERKTGTRAVT